MEAFHKYAVEKTQKVFDFFPIIIKAMLGGGIFGLILYFMRINYYPMGLSFSDSLNLFIISLTFGMIYFLLLLCNYSFGFFIYSLLEFSFICFSKSKRENFIVDLKLYIAREETHDIFLIPLGRLLYILLLIFFSLFFIFFYDWTFMSIICFSTSSFGTYIMLSMFYKDYSGKSFYGYKGPLILPESIDVEYKNNALKNKNKNLMVFLLVGTFMPLIGYFYDQENSRLLLASIKQFTISQKNNTIFVEKKYKERVPLENIECRGFQDKDFIKLKNTDILVYGLGKNAWVEFYPNDKLEKDGDKEVNEKNRRLEIPNDAIYIANLEVIPKVPVKEQCELK